MGVAGGGKNLCHAVAHLDDETSNVPPPRSYTMIFWSSSFVHAVGRGSRRLVDDALYIEARNGARVLVAWRWESLKYAGTVMTACVTFSPR